MVEKVLAASGSTVCPFCLSFSRLPLLTFEPAVRLVAIFPWFSLFFTFIVAVGLLKADKVARASAILNANLETSDESCIMRRSMFDDQFGCRLSGFMLAIDWQLSCRS